MVALNVYEYVLNMCEYVCIHVCTMQRTQVECGTEDRVCAYAQSGIECLAFELAGLEKKSKQFSRPMTFEFDGEFHQMRYFERENWITFFICLHPNAMHFSMCVWTWRIEYVCTFGGANRIAYACKDMDMVSILYDIREHTVMI